MIPAYFVLQVFGLAPVLPPVPSDVVPIAVIEAAAHFLLKPDSLHQLGAGLVIDASVDNDESSLNAALAELANQHGLRRGSMNEYMTCLEPSADNFKRRCRLRDGARAVLRVSAIRQSGGVWVLSLNVARLYENNERAEHWLYGSAGDVAVTRLPDDSWSASWDGRYYTAHWM